MAPNRGEILEEQLKNSTPAEAFFRKLHTPTPPISQMQQIEDMLVRLSRKSGERLPGWVIPTLQRVKFTPKSPFDILIAAPAGPREKGFRSWFEQHIGSPRLAGDPEHQNMLEVAGYAWTEALRPFSARLRDDTGGLLDLRVRPSISFALEAKCAGDGKSLPFDMVKDHQETGLLSAAGAGLIAGLVIEFPEVEPDGLLFFCPIQSYLAYKRECGRKSIPIEALQRMGLLIAVDVGRGRKHRYWKVAEFLRYFGADVPIAKEKAAAAVA